MRFTIRFATRVRKGERLREHKGCYKGTIIMRFYKGYYTTGFYPGVHKVAARTTRRVQNKL